MQGPNLVGDDDTATPTTIAATTIPFATRHARPTSATAGAAAPPTKTSTDSSALSTAAPAPTF